MARTSSARQDAIETAVRLFRTQGYSATGLTQLLEESGAPKGSFYFHFPGGKDQLALEALRAWGEKLGTRMRQRLEESNGDVPTFVSSLFKGLSRELVTSNYTGGCLASGLAVELTAENSAMADEVAKVIGGWVDIVADGVAPVMESREQAHGYAASLMAALSGMRIAARAKRSVAAIDDVEAFFIASLPRAPATTAKKSKAMK